MSNYISQEPLKSGKSKYSYLKPERLKEDEKNNKKLVTILNHKMFKGYRQIKKVTNPNFDLNHFMKKAPLDYYPLDDNYNIYYREKHLSGLSGRFNFNNSININKVAKAKQEVKPLFKSQTQNDIFLTNKVVKSPKEKSNLSSSNIFLRHLFLNEKEKQIYSNLPFLILNKNEDPSNYNGSKISDQGRNTKRSIGVSCNDKKQFLTTSISSSVIKQKEIEQQKKLEKKRMAASQSEFLFKLSHTKEMNDNAKQNFVKNKGLFHNKTMTNLFLKNKKKESKDNDFYFDKVSLESNPVLKIQVINENKSENAETNDTRKDYFKRNFEELYKSIEHFDENLDKFLDEEEEPKKDNGIVYVNEKSGPSSNESTIFRRNIIFHSPKTEEEKKMKKEKFLFMKSTIFGPKSIFSKVLPKTNEELSSNNMNDITTNMNALLEKTKVKTPFYFTIDNNSNLLKKKVTTPIESYQKEAKIKDRLLISMLSRHCTKNELNTILHDNKLSPNYNSFFEKEQS